MNNQKNTADLSYFRLALKGIKNIPTSGKMSDSWSGAVKTVFKTSAKFSNSAKLSNSVRFSEKSIILKI